MCSHIISQMNYITKPGAIWDVSCTQLGRYLEILTFRADIPGKIPRAAWNLSILCELPSATVLCKKHKDVRRPCSLRRGPKAGWSPPSWVGSEPHSLTTQLGPPNTPEDTPEPRLQQSSPTDLFAKRSLYWTQIYAFPIALILIIIIVINWLFLEIKSKIVLIHPFLLNKGE